MDPVVYIPISAGWCNAECEDNRSCKVLVVYREEFGEVIDNHDGGYTFQWFYESIHDAYILRIKWDNGVNIGIGFTRELNGYLLGTPAAQTEFSLLLMSERPSFNEIVFTGKNIVLSNIKFTPFSEAGWPELATVN